MIKINFENSDHGHYVGHVTYDGESVAEISVEKDVVTDIASKGIFGGLF